MKGKTVTWAVPATQGRAYEEMTPYEITKVLTHLKQKGVMRGKARAQQLEQSIADNKAYCAAIRLQLLESRKLLDNAIQQRYLTKEEAESWEQTFMNMNPQQATILIQAHPPEMEQTLTAIAQVAHIPNQLEETENWLNLYENLLQPTMDVAKLYEKEVRLSKADEKRYVDAQKREIERRQKELQKTKERIMIEKQMADRTDSEIPKVPSSKHQALVLGTTRQVDEGKQDDADEIIEALKNL